MKTSYFYIDNCKVTFSAVNNRTKSINHAVFSTVVPFVWYILNAYNPDFQSFDKPM